MGVPVNPQPPTPTPQPHLLHAFVKKSAWIQENGMNRCGTYYPLFSHLDALLRCLYICNQARSSQRRRFRVALSKLLIL